MAPVKCVVSHKWGIDQELGGVKDLTPCQSNKWFFIEVYNISKKDINRPLIKISPKSYIINNYYIKL